MGNLSLIYSAIPIVSTVITAIGLFLLVMSKHDFFSLVSPSLKRLPRNIQKRIRVYTQSQVESNPVLFYDLTRLTKDLQSSQIRFRGKPLTVKVLFLLSILAGLVLSMLCWVITTKTYYMPAGIASSIFDSSTLLPAMEQYITFNIPAVITCFILGFTIPRWYVFYKALKAKYEYQKEASQALHRLASSLRQSPNIEKAVTNAIPKLPKYTKLLFIDGKRNWDAKNFSTFSEMLFWIASKSEYSIWDEFANYALMASTMGMRDLVNNTMDLAKRAEDLLALKKDERKGLNVHMWFSVVTFVLLIGEILFLSIVNPDLGMALYNTPTGKLLISFVYIAIFFEIIVFSWLHYEV